MALMTEAERREKQAEIAEQIHNLVEERNALVQDYTARMQAATLPKVVLKLAMKLSEETFKMDLKLNRLEYEMPVTLAERIETETVAEVEA